MDNDVDSLFTQKGGKNRISHYVAWISNVEHMKNEPNENAACASASANSPSAYVFIRLWKHEINIRPVLSSVNSLEI